MLEHLDVCAECCRAVEELEKEVLANVAVGERERLQEDISDNCKKMIAGICGQAFAERSTDRDAGETEDAGEIVPENFRYPAKPDVLIDRYKLEELVGEGGMGSVWQAQQQTPVKRKVAIKLIKERLRTERAKVRFDAERQALALMDHPNIATILDAGSTAERQPYFVMEFVDGEKLTEHCDENRLNVRERLELFAELCTAIEHAHQKQIIHRDLKPSNVLVSKLQEKPTVKVIDFGLSKLLDEDNRLADRMSSTQLGDVVGTIRYMAPEQAFGKPSEIDTRADIYSLGVILYELLTGSTPIGDAAEGKIEMLEKLGEFRTLVPKTPSQFLAKLDDSGAAIAQARRTGTSKLTQILKGDLDWIVTRSLSAEPSRRYETASALRDDIQRFLDGEPVLARPPSVTYRTTKFLKRNWGPVTASTLVLGILLASGIGSYVVLVRSNQRLETAAAKIETEKDSAEERFQLALKSIRAYHSTVSKDTMLRKPELSEVRKNLLEYGREFYAQLAKQSEGSMDGEDRWQLALAVQDLADITADTGALDETIAINQQVVDLLVEVHKEFPDDPKKTRKLADTCLLYTSPSPRDQRGSRMPSSA